MITIKITKQDCEKHVFLNVPELVNPLVLQLTECIWHYFEIDKSKKEVDLTDFNEEMAHSGKFEIEKIDEGFNCVNLVRKKLKFNGKDGLAHELSHIINLNDFPTESLQEYIHSYCEKNKITSCNIIHYNSKCKHLNEKLVGYLYLAENDELIAKLTGFIHVDSNKVIEYKKSPFSEGVCEIYKEIQDLKITQKQFDEFIKFLSTNQSFSCGYIHNQLIDHLKVTGFHEIKKYLNDQGNKFLKEYSKVKM